MISQDIKDRLKERHRGDIYSEEALLGWSGSQRFDAWAMKPTWVDDICWGYEVKVSRSDFLNDNKWKNYLPFCTEFYFVCPHGLISVDELPKEVGLLYCSKSGGMLYTKRKAISRKITPENLLLMLKHVLMWRYRINYSPIDSAKKWLEDFKQGRELDYDLKARIRKQVDSEVGDALRKNKELEEENKTLQKIKQWSISNGVDFAKWDIEEELTSLKENGINEEMIRSIEDISVATLNFLNRVKPKNKNKERR